MLDGGPQILIVGGGYGGMRTALRLERRQDFRDALHVIATAPSHWHPSQTGKRKKLSSMLTTGEQQELCQIEQALRDADRGFAWRLALLQGLLRRVGPGRRAYWLVLAALTSTLLRLVAAAGRLLMTFAEGAVLMEPMALTALGDAGWPGGEPGRASCHRASPAQDQPRPDETGSR